MHCRLRKIQTNAMTETITQIALAAELGLSPDKLAKIREKKLEADVHYLTGRPLRYTPAGVEKIRDLLDLEKNSAPPPTPTPSPSLAQLGTLTVIRPMNNPRFVECQTAAGQRIELQVRANTHFLRGMTVPADRYDMQTTRPHLARLKGRPPRTRGRW